MDADSSLAHTVCSTAGNVNDVIQANSLLHGQESVVFADAGCQGAVQRPDVIVGVTWRAAMRPGKRRALDKTDEIDALVEQMKKLKARVRAKVEHPRKVLERQFGHAKVHYRGLTKDTAQMVTLFARSNLWMVQGPIDGGAGMSASNAHPKLPASYAMSSGWRFKAPVER